MTTLGSATSAALDSRAGLGVCRRSSNRGAGSCRDSFIMWSEYFCFKVMRGEPSAFLDACAAHFASMSRSRAERWRWRGPAAASASSTACPSAGTTASAVSSERNRAEVSPSRSGPQNLASMAAARRQASTLFHGALSSGGAGLPCTRGVAGLSPSRPWPRAPPGASVAARSWHPA